MVGTLIWRVTGNELVVEDLTQETFLRVFRALGTFDSRARLSTWIYTIAHRVALDHLRQAGRWRNESFVSDDDLARSIQSEGDPESSFSQEETVQLVQEALAQLPEKYRIALVYAAIEQLDYSMIAAMLGVPVGTVKTLVYRGKQMLREYIIARRGSNAL